ncbi:MAG: hypothetical protein AB1486_12525 [Planctomycetota bacterium]
MELARSLSLTVIELSRGAVRRCNPELADWEVNLRFVAHCYGDELADRLGRFMDRQGRQAGSPLHSSDLAIATTPVVELLERLGVDYYICGSVASSAFGVPRSTLDVDLVADLSPVHVDRLVDALRDQYYVEASLVRRAIECESSFNLIHLQTMLKIDVFVCKTSAYDRQMLERSRRGGLSPEQNAQAKFASPEDTILHKVLWYQKGGGVSERQWSDVLGVMKVQRDQLDLGYMRHWAQSLGIADLLERAIGEARD